MAAGRKHGSSCHDRPARSPELEHPLRRIEGGAGSELHRRRRRDPGIDRPERRRQVDRLQSHQRYLSARHRHRRLRGARHHGRATLSRRAPRHRAHAPDRPAADRHDRARQLHGRRLLRLRAFAAGAGARRGARGAGAGRARRPRRVVGRPTHHRRQEAARAGASAVRAAEAPVARRGAGGAQPRRGRAHDRDPPPHPRARRGDPDDRAFDAGDHEPVGSHRGLELGTEAGRGQAAGSRPRQEGHRGLSRRSGACCEAAYRRRGCGAAVSENLLTVENLETGYGEVQVLWGVSLKVPRGRLTAIIGANGAGKTTTLGAIVGQIRPWRGRITFEGMDVTHLAPHQKVARGLVLVPEGRQLFAAMTVEENLEMGAFSRRAARKFAERLEQVYALFPRLKERRRQKAGTFSGGEQQMLAIARGLMSDPDVLMIDELSLGLAPVVVQQLFGTLKRLKDSGLTILLVEQNIHLALALSDYAYVIAEGKLFAEGPAREVAARPDIRKAYLGL